MPLRLPTIDRHESTHLVEVNEELGVQISGRLPEQFDPWALGAVENAEGISVLEGYVIRPHVDEGASCHFIPLGIQTAANHPDAPRSASQC
jgi:hypothetical protein